MDFKNFESLERKLFLDKYYDFTKTKLLLPSLQVIHYPLIKDRTDRGICQGVNDFIAKEGVKNLYLSDLSRFAFDVSVESRVKEQINSLSALTGSFPDDPEQINGYAVDVCETYRMFIYNESKRRFDRFFKND